MPVQVNNQLQQLDRRVEFNESTHQKNIDSVDELRNQILSLNYRMAETLTLTNKLQDTITDQNDRICRLSNSMSYISALLHKYIGNGDYDELVSPSNIRESAERNEPTLSTNDAVGHSPAALRTHSAPAMPVLSPCPGTNLFSPVKHDREQLEQVTRYIKY